MALHCTALHDIALHCITLHCTALHYITWHCMAAHITLNCTALHYTLHCIELHYTAHPRPTWPYLQTPHAPSPAHVARSCPPDPAACPSSANHRAQRGAPTSPPAGWHLVRMRCFGGGAVAAGRVAGLRPPPRPPSARPVRTAGNAYAVRSGGVCVTQLPMVTPEPRRGW